MLKQRIFLLIISLLLNSFGNALAISTHLGAVIWTASGQGVGALLNVSLSSALIIYGIAILLINALLAHEFNWRRIIGNFLFMFPFSLLIDHVAAGLEALHLGALPFAVRLGLNIVAVILIGIAVALYQQANLIMHPNDDLMYTLRFKYSHGNATTGQLKAYVIPIALTIIAFIFKGEWFGIGIGTLISLILQGPIIDMAHRLLFKNKQLTA